MRYHVEPYLDLVGTWPYDRTVCFFISDKSLLVPKNINGMKFPRPVISTYIDRLLNLKPIDARQVFLFYVNISTQFFGAKGQHRVVQYQVIWPDLGHFGGNLSEMAKMFQFQ